MINTFKGQLTRYTAGSVQELWVVSYPVILSLFSVNLMIFMDRFILAKCDVEAMNSVVIADLVFNLFQLGAIEIASISEIFVGQYNGARKYQHIGKIVWQAIWFSLASTLFFVPLALFGGSYLLPAEHLTEGLPFFKCITLFGPMFPFHAALAAFFTGQGRAKLVMMVTLLSNLLNALLDFILIFGVSDWIPALGASGAAMATGIAQTVQVLFLLLVFLQRHYRETYGTGNWRFNRKVFWQIFQVGYLKAALSMTGLVAWSVLSQIVARMSHIHLTVFSIGDSFYTLFAFSFWGIQRGVTTVVANYLGAERDELVRFCLKSAIKIVLVVAILFSAPLFGFSEILVKQFFSHQSTLINEELLNYSSQTLWWMWVYFTLDAIAWVISGVLTAANDIKYVVFLNAFSIWVFLVIPNYFCLVYLDSSPVTVWMFCALAASFNVIGFYLRYRSQQWSAIRTLPAYNY